MVLIQDNDVFSNAWWLLTLADQVIESFCGHISNDSHIQYQKSLKGKECQLT